MILLYTFENKKENIRVSSDFTLNGSMLTVSFLIDDKDHELEDFYPVETGKEISGTLFPLENLWTSTCFEIFLKNSQSNDYYEFNFNSKADWNVFYFSDYRQRVESFKPELKVNLKTLQVHGRPLLVYSVDIKSLNHLKAPALVNMAAVTKGKSGISYWSQKHNGLKPDFHDFKNFSLILNSSEGNKNG